MRTNNSSNNTTVNAATTSGTYSTLWNATTFPARYNLNFLKSYASANTSISSGTLVLNASNPLNTANIVGIPTLETSMENWLMTMEIKNPMSGGAEEFVGIGTNSTNDVGAGAKRDLICTFDTSNSATKGKLKLWTGTDGSFVSRADNAGNLLTVAVNDVIRITLGREANVATATCTNLTQGGTKTINYTYSTSNASAEPAPPNLGRFGIYNLNFATAVTVNNVKLETTIPNKPKCLIIGDSKLTGYSCTTYSNRLISRINSNFAGSTYGLTGPSDTTAHNVKQLWLMKRLQPRVCVIAVGCNDIRYGITYNAYSANLMRMYSELTDAGIAVVFTGAEETAINQQELFNFFAINFPDNYYIATGLTLNADGIHVTDADNLIWYNGLIPIIQKYLS